MRLNVLFGERNVVLDRVTHLQSEFSKTLQCMLSLKNPPSKPKAVFLLSCHQLAESGTKHIVYLKHDLTDKNHRPKRLCLG